MELRLADTFLPLLLLTWLPAGLAHRISVTVNVSVGLDLILQCLPQAGLSSSAGEVKWFNVTRNNGENPNKCGVEMKSDSAQLVFASVNKTHAGTYMCGMEDTKNTSENSCSKGSTHDQTENPTKASQTETCRQNEGTGSPAVKPVSTVQCKFEICLENLTVQVKWYEPECVEGRTQTIIAVLRENSTSFTSSSTCPAPIQICGCRVSIKRPDSTDTGNSTQPTAPSSDPAGPETNVTGTIWKGLNLWCILLGLMVGTLLYTPVLIGLLQWQCRRNRTGKLTSREVAEGNHVSTQAAPVTGTEDLIYANLKFEKKGTAPASSNVIYTEIKPSQQKQRGGDATAASTEVDVSP